MKIRALIFITLLFLVGCSTAPKGESAEALVEKGCEMMNINYDSDTATYFFKASKMDEKYRELSRAYASLSNVMKTVLNEKADSSARRTAALKAQDELAILTSYCGP